MKSFFLPRLGTCIFLSLPLFCSCSTVKKEDAGAAQAGQIKLVDDKQDGAKAPGGGTSIWERKLYDINAEQEELFTERENHTLSQDDFERRILNLASRYDELVAGNPNNVDLLLIYGKFLRRINQNEQANTMFSHVDSIKDDIPVVKQQLGNYMAETGHYAEALAYYVRAQELDPNEAVYHYGIGELLATFRDSFKKEGIYTDDMLDRGILSAFGRAVELDPENKDFCFRTGEAFYDLATPQWDRALAYWEDVAQRGDLTDFERDVVRLHRARVLCELARRTEALALLRDEVAPFLAATRTRLLKRISQDLDAAAEAAEKADAPEVAPIANESSADATGGDGSAQGVVSIPPASSQDASEAAAAAEGGTAEAPAQGGE